MSPDVVFYLLLALVAFLYASVGHGGASGYLAIMILYSFEDDTMKSTALVLNCFVAAISFVSFAIKKNFDLRVFLYVGIISIPAAYLGGKIKTDDSVYKLLLGIMLLIAILKLIGIFNLFQKERRDLTRPNLLIGLILGSGIGFLSGMLGIGGGILLTPALLFLRWSTIKDAAGISALFIVVNSLAGLFGKISSDTLVLPSDIALLIPIAIAGGLVGGYFGSFKFNNTALRYLLACVLLVASYKLFFGQ